MKGARYVLKMDNDMIFLHKSRLAHKCSLSINHIELCNDLSVAYVCVYVYAIPSVCVYMWVREARRNVKLRTVNEQYNYDVVNDTLAKYRWMLMVTFEDASHTIQFH